ncbi:hypothetical protein SAMN05428960_1046 [Mitsuaria sp. PDC51]|uniref:hypothetical protein n=1 Tax=Mitsuaria sp. PDC51 TaxID=1881035 RepID=UPI0008E03FBA|nr:hypothetical protein [Mitsuaria sp. PDC51]SFR74962.1 hypothetical protein SAMN05428960_1046 [Mitsuaria sp. PDC51]
MKVCMCRFCGVKHESVMEVVLVGMSKEEAYTRTHCRYCEAPASSFLELPDEPELGIDEIGYPSVVISKNRFGAPTN